MEDIDGPHPTVSANPRHEQEENIPRVSVKPPEENDQAPEVAHARLDRRDSPVPDREIQQPNGELDPEPIVDQAREIRNAKAASQRRKKERDIELEEILPSTGHLSHYEIQRQIGSGRFSTVYRAKSVKDNGRLVAIKKIQIFDIMDSKSRQKCLREVKLLQSISRHPNLVTYLDSFIADNELIIVFEWAELGDLRRLLKATKTPLEEGVVWGHFVQIVNAVKHIHEHRVMHRDIKPANIFIGSQCIKLGDLGLGRELNNDSHEAFSKVGTPLYMSPEVLHGQGYDFKSDIWSLGCLLYELAMLKSPFEGNNETLYDIFNKINSCQYARVPDTYSPELRGLVEVMIQPDPKKRPQAAEVLQIASQQYVKYQNKTNGFILMDDAHQKLKLLDYENKFCKANGIGLLSSTYFALPDDSPSRLAQFDVLVMLFRWLYELCHRKLEEIFPDDRTATATVLLDAANKLSIMPDFGASRLKAGFGESVCWLLNEMCDAALSSSDFKWKQPVHTIEQVLEELEECDAIEIIDDTSQLMLERLNTSIVEDDTHDEREMPPPLDRSRVPSAALLLDPTRVVAPSAMPAETGWYARSHHLARTALKVLNETPEVQRGMSAVIGTIEQDISMIRNRESLVNQQAAPLLTDLHQLQENLQGLNSAFGGSSSGVNDRANELSDINEQLESLKQQIDECTASVKDEEPLCRIKAACSLLKEEVKTMDVRIQVLRHTLLKKHNIS